MKEQFLFETKMPDPQAAFDAYKAKVHKTKFHLIADTPDDVKLAVFGKQERVKTNPVLYRDKIEAYERILTMLDERVRSVGPEKAAAYGLLDHGDSRLDNKEWAGVMKLKSGGCLVFGYVWPT